MLTATEILINASLVANPKRQFEFIVNKKFIINQNNKKNNVIFNNLFTVNNIKINPNYNNKSIINKLKNTLEQLNINIKKGNANNVNLDIKQSIRFYIKENNQIIFLAATAKPKLIYYNSNI